jgi:TolB-like protein
MNGARKPHMHFLYRFPTFDVLVAERQVRMQDGTLLNIGSRAFDLLLALIERSGRTVGKKELLHAVWQKLLVEESNIQVQISLLRSQLGKNVIATIPSQGYRLTVQPIKVEPNAIFVQVLDSPDQRRIAVLPFWSKNGSPDIDLLALGIAHEVMTELSRNSDLRVISHHSSFAFSSNGLAFSDIGRRLRSRYLVDGSVDYHEQNFSIHVELRDVIDDQLIWSYQETFSEMEFYKVRDTLVRKISGSVHTRAQHTETTRAMNSSSAALNTFGKIWKACGLATQFTGPSIREARSLLEQIVRSHPNHSSGWAWLAYVNALDMIMRISGEWQPSRYQEFKGQAETALSLDPENATVHRALSIGFRAKRDFDAALVAAKHAVNVAPSNAYCLQVLAEAQCVIGNTTKAIDIIEDTLDLHPYPPAWVYAVHAYILWANRHLDDALAAANNGLAEMPHFWPARVVRIYTLHELGRKQDAAGEAFTILRQMPRLSITALLNYWKDTATDLRKRVMNAGLSAGIPPGRYAKTHPG